MKKKERNPSVVLHFRVKVNSPLYTWLNAKADSTGSLSQVIRDVMEHHRLNVVDLEHFKAIKRNAELWACMREYLQPDWGDTHIWENFWKWMKWKHEEIYKL